MKIAMLATTMPKFPCEAISKNVSILSKELQKMGHKIKVFTVFRASKDFRTFLSSSNPLIFPYHYIFSQKRLRDALKIFRPDFSITHFGLLGTNLMLLNYANIIPFVYSYPSSLRDCLSLQREMIGSGLSSGLSDYTHFLNPFCFDNPKIYRIILERSTLAVFSSENLKETYERFAPRSSVLNLAISDEELRSSEDITQNRTMYREKWNLSEKDTAIGFLGHPSFKKGTDLVMETFANLSRARGEGKLRLMLATSPYGTLDVNKLLRKFPTTIRKDVRVFNYVHSLEFIGVLDLLLFPLRSHLGTTAVPRTLLEAILAGTPIIVGNVNPSIQKLCSGTKIGLTTNRSLADLFSKSNQVLDNLESFRQGVLLERRRIIPAYHVKRVAKELIQALLG